MRPFRILQRNVTYLTRTGQPSLYSVTAAAISEALATGDKTKLKLLRREARRRRKARRSVYTATAARNSPGHPANKTGLFSRNVSGSTSMGTLEGRDCSPAHIERPPDSGLRFGGVDIVRSNRADRRRRRKQEVKEGTRGLYQVCDNIFYILKSVVIQ